MRWALSGDPHGPIIGEVDPQPVRDLLRTPRVCPPAVLATPVPPTDPPHLRPRHGYAVGPPDLAHQPLLHIAPEPLVGSQLGDLGALSTPVGVPLGGRGRGPILQAPATVAALRPSSLETVAGDRPSRRAISRPPTSWAPRMASSSRSANDRERPDSGARLRVGMPPPSRNQRDPTAGDTPAATPAASLEDPRAIAAQNHCRRSRRPTGGRPGERIAGRPARSAARRFLAPIATPHRQGVATTS
jgi:hypothetical protein